MNTFADGSSLKSNALVLALGLPGMLTTWMLNQSEILGLSNANQNPIATISDVGQTIAGHNITLDAKASFDPSGNALTNTWNFGDGNHSNGVAITHTYTRTGTYDLKLTVSTKSGMSTITKVINVVTQPTIYNNPYAQNQQNGVPPTNPAVMLPTPDDQLSDKVTTVAAATATAANPLTLPSSSPSTTTSPTFAWIFGAFVLLILLIIGIVVFLQRRKSNI